MQEYFGIAEAALRPARRMVGRVLRNAKVEELTGRRVARHSPRISDLGIIGDRRTAAVITRSGEICWYSPGRFDAPSFFNALIDPDAGGSWKIELPDSEPCGRNYIGDSSILETRLRCPRGELAVTDWMPAAGALFHGAICRRIEGAPADFSMIVVPGADDGKSVPFLQRAGEAQVVIDRRFRLQASHPIEIRGAALRIKVPRGDPSWALLIDNAVASPMANEEKLKDSYDATLAAWERLASWVEYDGPFKKEGGQSLRALRMLTYEPTGAVAAAVTTSLPEVVGGKRNFDYRYSWLRDSGMIIRALVRFDPKCREARHYLAYVAALLDTGYQSPLDPISAVGGERVPKQRKLRVTGYKDSRPNFSGNNAAHQLQLGSLANLVLAASEIYTICGAREHWEVVKATAEALARKWRDPGNGIWEEKQKHHYTSSLVLTACALERISHHAGEDEGKRWCAAAKEIRDFVEARCRKAGVFAATPETSKVDISVGLFTTWGYVDAEDPGMARTIETLNSQYCVGEGLYHRHLVHPEVVKKEGAFLVGTFWVAHYWAARKDREKACKLIEQGLSYGNDLGLFSEEIDSRSNEALGNIPLGLIHGSFLSVVADLAGLEAGRENAAREQAGQE